VPLIRPLILFAVILRLIDILRMFDIIYVMTGGGPGIATETLHYYAYKIGLSHGGNISYASSLAIFLLFLIEGLALLILKVSRGEKA
jgi:multiple sugar transport system permease protein